MKKTWRVIAGIALAAAALTVNHSPQVQRFFAAPQASAASAMADAQGNRVLIPGGQAVGIALRTQGVLVVAGGAQGERKNPLREGDLIVSAAGRRIDSTAALAEAVSRSGEDTLQLGVVRGGREMTLEASVPIDGTDGKRRLGVWVRDSTAGVGTLSYIDPDTGAYGALGHAIVDADTGAMLTVQDGAVLDATVVGVARGQAGKAGELRGSFLKEGRQIGTLDMNCARGIYGWMDKKPE
ncbi:MAG: hypothetical protein IKB82_05595, partial [Clostridia bacterium]|nr:hypothetical protein [Clostridia bacterium]